MPSELSWPKITCMEVKKKNNADFSYFLQCPLGVANFPEIPKTIFFPSVSWGMRKFKDKSASQKESFGLKPKTKSLPKGIHGNFISLAFQFFHLENVL